jgi:hypothetical protein
VIYGVIVGDTVGDWVGIAEGLFYKCRKLGSERRFNKHLPIYTNE